MLTLENLVVAAHTARQRQRQRGRRTACIALAFGMLSGTILGMYCTDRIRNAHDVQRVARCSSQTMYYCANQIKPLKFETLCSEVLGYWHER